MISYGKEICRHVYYLLDGQKQIQGSIHSIFNRVCNLTFKDWPIISLMFNSLPIKPMAISFKPSKITSFHDLEIDKGHVVLYNDGQILVPQIGFRLNLKGAKVHDSRPAFEFDTGNDYDIRKNIAELRNILQKGNPLGLLPVICCFEESIGEIGDIISENRNSQFAWPRISNLIKSINQGDMRGISNSASNIAGFGPGLTPSADDMLVGIMISFIYAANYYNWQNDYEKSINSSILKGAEGKTTQLSYEIMSFAAQGEVTKNIHDLMKCIYSKPGKFLYENAMDVMNYGETSGSDLLTGIYIGCKISGLIKA